MKILVTGSSGFIGTHFVQRVSEKHEIVPYDISLKRNILDTKKLAKHMKGVDVVVHLAALLNQAESWEKPQEYFMTNGIGTYNVFKEAAKQNVKRIIYFSSAAIYSEFATPYGLSKIMGENMTKLFKNDLDIIIMRPFNVYGPSQKVEYNYAIHTFAHQIRNGKAVTIFGDGKQTRDFLHVDDLITMMEFFLTSKKITTPIDIGTGKSVTMKKLALLIGKILDKEIAFEYLPQRKEPLNSQADTKKLEKLGINPKKFISLEKGLKNLLSEV